MTNGDTIDVSIDGDVALNGSIKAADASTVGLEGALPDYVKPVTWLEKDKNAYEVFKRRYSLKDDDGNPTERPHETFYRVARHLARAGHSLTHESENNTTWLSEVMAEKDTEKFYRLMAERRGLPNSPTFTGAGTPLGNLAACF